MILFHLLAVLLLLLRLSCGRRWLTYDPVQDSFVEKPFIDTDPGPVFDKNRGVKQGEWAGRHALNTSIPPVSSDSSTWVYGSQAGQDKLVLQILGQRRNGFYLEIGSRYWMKNSNTFALDVYYDWKGICVEPDKKFSRGLVLNRSCIVITDNPVTAQPRQKVLFHYQVNPHKANHGNENEFKQTITLDQLFTHIKDIHIPSTIDYLSLDVEGQELNALLRFPFHTHRFLVATIERPTWALHNLLVKHAYYFLTTLEDFGETVYVHGSVPGFAALMQEYRLGSKRRAVRDDMKFLLVPTYLSALRS